MSKNSRFEDWQVELVIDKHYAIFHKEVNQEWTDANGDNLCFETAKEARQYLAKVFKKGEASESTSSKLD